jgi:tetrahydromethanopterin S-methyltransferase subunit G
MQVQQISLRTIENRLSSVENTLQEILENGDAMENRLKDQLSDINEEIMRNTAQVRKLKSQMVSRFKPIGILISIIVGLLLWVTFISWWRI